MGSSKFKIDCAINALEKIYVLAIFSNNKLYFVGHTVNHNRKKAPRVRLLELPLVIVTAFNSSFARFWKKK